MVIASKKTALTRLHGSERRYWEWDEIWVRLSKDDKDVRDDKILLATDACVADDDDDDSMLQLHRLLLLIPECISSSVVCLVPSKMCFG